MTDAYRCDECDTFGDGDAPLSLSMRIEGDDAGLLGGLFGVNGGPSETYDFCSIACAESFDFNAVREGLIAEVDDKQQVLDADVSGASGVVEE